MVRRRASQASRSAVSGLSGPAPSSSGGSSWLRCTIRVVGLRLAPPPVASAVPGECDQRVGCGLLPVEAGAGVLVERALGFGDVPDGLLEDDALLQRQTAVEAELASPTRPAHAQRAALVELLVIGDRGRSHRAGGQGDGAGRLADCDARELRVGLGRRVLGGGRNLIERQRTRAQRLVERGQAAQRRARARDHAQRCGNRCWRPARATARSRSSPPRANPPRRRPRARSA